MTGKSSRQHFAALPLRVIGDELSGLQLRVLACVASFDWMSTARSRGRGQGCRASNQKMAEMLGCDYSRLSATLSALVSRGYLTREQSTDNRRHSVYRVVYDTADSLPNGKPDTLPDGKAPDPTVCETANESDKTVCREISESRRNLPEMGSKEIPLNGERYSEESGKRNSEESARLTARWARQSVPRTDGEALKLIEDTWKAEPARLVLSNVLVWLDDVVARRDPSEPEYRWAERLANEIWSSENSDDAGAASA